MIDRILPEPCHEGATSDPVHAVEIPWCSAPLPRPELLSPAALLELDPPGLIAYALDLQDELEAVRALLHESIGALSLAHHQRDRLQTRMRLLLDALRAARGIGGDH